MRGLRFGLTSVAVPALLVLIGGCAAQPSAVARDYPPLSAGSAAVVYAYDNGSIASEMRVTARGEDVALLNRLISAPQTAWHSSLNSYVPQVLIDTDEVSIDLSADGWIVINPRGRNDPAPQYVRRLSDGESRSVDLLLRRWGGRQ